MTDSNTAALNQMEYDQEQCDKDYETYSKDATNQIESWFQRRAKDNYDLTKTIPHREIHAELLAELILDNIGNYVSEKELAEELVTKPYCPELLAGLLTKAADMAITEYIESNEDLLWDVIDWLKERNEE